VTPRLAVFDCDGTLVDSQANIVRAMEDCFTKHRLEPPCRDAVLRVVGLSLAEAMGVLVPDAEADLHARLADEYKLAFQALRSSGGLIAEPLYPGVREGLLRLERAGWMLGVATGKSDRGLALTLTHHGIHGRFVTLQTADRHPSKPHPSMLMAAMAETGAAPEGTVMVGDTVFDMEMAVAAGTHPVGVGWGYHDGDELTQAGAAAVFEDFAEMTAHMMETAR
jgi:phosphoglycolate phosphatase